MPNKKSGSNSKDDTPRKWGWFDTLWKYRWPIAAVVVAVGVGLAITVATSGVGALVVAPVATVAVAHYAPSTVAAITSATVGGAGLLGFVVNRAFKISKSNLLGNNGKFTWNSLFKELLGTDQNTKTPEKLVKQNLSNRGWGETDEQSIKNLYTAAINKDPDNVEYVIKEKNGVPSKVTQVKSGKKFALTIDEVLENINAVKR